MGCSPEQDTDLIRQSVTTLTERRARVESINESLVGIARMPDLVALRQARQSDIRVAQLQSDATERQSNDLAERTINLALNLEGPIQSFLEDLGLSDSETASARKLAREQAENLMRACKLLLESPNPNRGSSRLSEVAKQIFERLNPNTRQQLDRLAQAINAEAGRLGQVMSNAGVRERPTGVNLLRIIAKLQVEERPINFQTVVHRANW